MYGLISLYLAYVIYLIIYFRSDKRDLLYKKITLILGLKLIILTSLYLAFFNQKMTKDERNNNIQNLILTEK
jgi:4-amino-4-deoxy-L-arabinose transferase-like glycosyltransferase